jgi:rubrerythrin
MLSKEDYKGYLGEMMSLELKMVDVYGDCSERVKDGNIKKVTKSISDTESRHAEIVREIIKLVA